MKKMVILLSFDEVIGLDQWIGDMVKSLHCGYAQQCAAATLEKWRLTKLKPKTYYRPDKDIRFTLDAPTALALAALIQTNALPTGSYMGNSLLQIFGTIDKTFK